VLAVAEALRQRRYLTGDAIRGIFGARRSARVIRRRGA
jgi:hypothetical protein